MMSHNIVKSEFDLEKITDIANFTNSCVVLLQGDYGKRASYQLANSIYQQYSDMNIVDKRRDFSFWCELQDDFQLKDINGEKIKNINNCYKHMILSEHKTKGIFFIHIANNCSKYAIENMVRQIDDFIYGNLFFLIYGNNVANLIEKECPCSKVFVLEDNCVRIFGSVWDNVNEKNKISIKKLSSKPFYENMLLYLSQKLCANPQQDINNAIDAFIKNLTCGENTIGFG